MQLSYVLFSHHIVCVANAYLVIWNIGLVFILCVFYDSCVLNFPLKCKPLITRLATFRLKLLPFLLGEVQEYCSLYSKHPLIEYCHLPPSHVRIQLMRKHIAHCAHWRKHRHLRNTHSFPQYFASFPHTRWSNLAYKRSSFQPLFFSSLEASQRAGPQVAIEIPSCLRVSLACNLCPSIVILFGHQ